MNLLEGRVAIVTGGASGIGLAVVRRMLEEGADVMVADADPGRLIEVESELQGMRGSLVTQRLDVRDAAATKAAAERALAELGRLDALVNCAGVTRDGLLHKMPLADWHLVIDVSLTGSMLMSQAVVPMMRAAGGGAIVNVSSISGKVGMFGQTNYSSAKAGLVGLTKASAKELARFGIRVNVIQPGLIETPMTQGLRTDIREQKLTEVPLGRIGTAQEVADVVLFLCSEMSSYMTGGVLEVAGGRFM